MASDRLAHFILTNEDKGPLPGDGPADETAIEVIRQLRTTIERLRARLAKFDAGDGRPTALDLLADAETREQMLEAYLADVKRIDWQAVLWAAAKACKKDQRISLDDLRRFAWVIREAIDMPHAAADALRAAREREG